MGESPYPRRGWHNNAGLPRESSFKRGYWSMTPSVHSLPLAGISPVTYIPWTGRFEILERKYYRRHSVSPRVKIQVRLSQADLFYLHAAYSFSFSWATQHAGSRVIRLYGRSANPRTSEQNALLRHLCRHFDGRYISRMQTSHSFARVGPT